MFIPKNVFVTVGSTSFDELVQTVIDPVTIDHLKSLGCERLTIQAGKFPVGTKGDRDIKIRSYKYSKDLTEDISNADLVIGHAGAGTCLEVLRQRKRLLVVINDSLMDGHQEEIADKLMGDRYLISSKLKRFHEGLDRVCSDRLQLREFPPQTNKFDSIFHRALMKAKGS